MKRLFVLSLVAVLSVGLLSVGAFAQAPEDAPDQSENTYVEWTIDAPMQCSLTLDAHAGIDLGTLDEIDVNYSASGAGYGAPERTITTSSNCRYNVNVEVTNVVAPISDSSVREDFFINIDQNSGPHQSINSFFSDSNWKTTSGWGGNNTKLVGHAGSDADYGTVDNASWVADYMYQTDYNDVNNDAYRVNLQYTASTD